MSSRGSEERRGSEVEGEKQMLEVKGWRLEGKERLLRPYGARNDRMKGLLAMTEEKGVEGSRLQGEGRRERKSVEGPRSKAKSRKSKVESRR